jgi:integrase/recombinase XerD
MTGLRQAEAAHLMWSDIDLKRKEIIVCAKPHLGFRLKDREERRVPIPPDLIPILEERRTAVPHHKFVVGSRADTPDKKWLVKLKKVAQRAGLNCGNCRM